MNLQKHFKVFKQTIAVGLMFGVPLGCAPVISAPVLKEVDPRLTLGVVQQNIKDHIGQTVWWNGTILKATNTPQGTVFEILQKPADSRGKPHNVDHSQGRFLAIHPGYLDVAIYSKDRKISVAGIIHKVQTRPLGEIQYDYPYLKIRELRLWPKEKPQDVIFFGSDRPFIFNRPPYRYYHRPKPKIP